MRSKIILELTQEEANVILKGLREVMLTEEHGSERIAVVDHISNLILDSSYTPSGDSNGC